MTTPMFRDIPQFTQSKYQTDISWRQINQYIQELVEKDGLNLDPEFQRLHVWTEQQQQDFVEYQLRGGISGRDLYFNHPGWMSTFEGDMVIVDGKQRLEAIRRFMANEITAFGYKYEEYGDKVSYGMTIKFHVNDLKDYKDVVQWYLDLNTGGTDHTPEEIDKAKSILESLKKDR